MWQYLFWVVLFVAAFIVEGLTMQLVSLWFAVGSAAALIVSFFTDSFVVQATVFVLVSLLLFLTARPLIRKFNRTPMVHTNADSVIGMEGIVKEEIDSLAGTGRVYVNGLYWAARSEQNIPAGEKITVLSVQGVTLTVRSADSPVDTVSG